MTDQYSKLTNATIMMVDDEPITMEMVRIFLEEDGYTRFCLEEDSTLAMQTLEEVAPDILLLDLMMPKVSGFEILEKVRAHGRYKHLPVIILTSSTDTENKLKALDLGATDFLAKPVDQSELRLRVRNTLAAKAYTDQLAFYDPLTNLPNRLMFFEQFNWAIKKAQRHDEQLALLDISMDDFGRINASLGVKGGDEILIQVAERIRNMIRSSDVLSHYLATENIGFNLFRNEGGAFLLLLERLKQSADASLVARRLLELVSEPITIGTAEIHLTASIGIALYPEEGQDSNTLLKRANSARDFVKKGGGNTFQHSSQSINAVYQRRLDMENQLRKALEKEELLLHYQPKVNCRNGKVEGVEALIRWVREDTIISPATFIPFAEETRLIVPIGKWVLQEACNQLARWTQQGAPPLSMSVNVSAVQFGEDDFFNVVQEIIAQSGINPHQLKLEFTESLLLENIKGKISQLNKLKELGLQLSIDDFGTGYSSLSYLSQLPVDELKIDRSFMSEDDSQGNNRAILSSILYLAQQLGLQTVAEGVETTEQLHFVTEANCSLYQGYYFSKPLPPEKLFSLYLFQS